MSDIGKRIAELRKERKLSQETLADMSDVHRVLIAKYETGKVEPSAQSILKLADALGVPADVLLAREDKLPPFIQVTRNTVPVVGAIACGEPITAEQNIDGFASLPDGVTADFALRCQGDSMLPTFSPGDLVLIRQQCEVEPGQIAAVGIDGEATLKRFYRQDGGFVLVADNPAFAPLVYPAGADVRIYGRAIGFVRVW